MATTSRLFTGAAIAAAALQMMEQDLVKLEALCRGKGTQLVAVRSYGLIGSLRVRTCGAQGSGLMVPQAAQLMKHAF